jgi:uncharacterized protein (DUF2147 family)
MFNKIKSLMFLLGLIAYFSGNAQNRADSIIGKWYSSEVSKSTLLIVKGIDGLYNGKIIETSEKEHLDKYVITKCIYVTADRSWKGEVKPPDVPISLKGNFTLLNPNLLKVFCGKGFISKTIYWHRVSK